MPKSEFEISLVRELKFFLEFLVKLMKDGIILSQRKYDKKLVNKFELDNSPLTCTLMITIVYLSQDPSRREAVKTLNRCMIGILLYLIVSLLDISFSIVAYSIVWYLDDD